MSDDLAKASKMQSSFFGSRWVQWILYIVIWTAVGLFFASYSSLWGKYIYKSPITWEYALKTNLAFY